MTIDEAIEIVEHMERWQHVKSNNEYAIALKLGVEALQRVKLLRSNFARLGLDELPGETEE